MKYSRYFILNMSKSRQNMSWRLASLLQNHSWKSVGQYVHGKVMAVL